MSAMPSDDFPRSNFPWHDSQGLRPLINVAGTMTGLGASIASREVAAAAAGAMENFVSIHEAQSLASGAIQRATGAEAGFMTASASAGITLSVAACMTGMDPVRVEALPGDTGPRNEVVVQAGHLCGYGAPLAQAVALSGARVKTAGQSTKCADYQVAGALGDTVAAGLYVVSHHAVHYGQCPLRRFAALCRDAEVPVIVDAASEYDLRGFLAAGADVVVYSGHKFLGGPTAGIVAGRRDLIRAAYLQNIGIGRGMKIGKESIFGAIAALKAWETRDHAGIRAAEERIVANWKAALAGIEGVRAVPVTDPTGNPITRLQVELDPAILGFNAATAARALAERNPAVIVRNHQTELGFFQLDPCNLKDGQEPLVAAALREVLGGAPPPAPQAGDDAIPRNSAVAGYLQWDPNGM